MGFCSELRPWWRLFGTVKETSKKNLRGSMDHQLEDNQLSFFFFYIDCQIIYSKFVYRRSHAVIYEVKAWSNCNFTPKEGKYANKGNCRNHERLISLNLPFVSSLVSSFLFFFFFFFLICRSKWSRDFVAKENITIPFLRFFCLHRSLPLSCFVAWFIYITIEQGMKRARYYVFTFIFQIFAT